MADDAAAAEATVAAAREKRFRDVADKIRSNADLTAKALGGLGSALLTAIGIAKIGDLWPLPDTNRGWFAAGVVVASFCVMAFVLAFITLRFWRLNEALVYASDVDDMEDLRGREEKRKVRDVYERTSNLNNVHSLAAYEARAQRLYRIAARTDDENEAKRIRAEADAIAAEVVATQARAAVVIIRRRASQALRGRAAKAAYAGFVVAAIAFALSTDWLESERSAKITLAKECLAAAEEGATREALPELCRDHVRETAESDDADPSAEVDKGRDAISSALTACRAAADKTDADDLSDCAVLAQALLAVTEP